MIGLVLVLLPTMSKGHMVGTPQRQGGISWSCSTWWRGLGRRSPRRPQVVQNGERCWLGTSIKAVRQTRQPEQQVPLVTWSRGRKSLVEGPLLNRCEMKFKEAERNLLVILLEVLQGNKLGVGVEVVPVKQVLVYQVVIRLVVSMGMGRMDMVEIQQVVDNHLEGVFLAAFVEVFLEDLEVVGPLVLLFFTWRTSWWRRWSRWQWRWCPWRAATGVAGWADRSARIDQGGGIAEPPGIVRVRGGSSPSG